MDEAELEYYAQTLHRVYTHICKKYGIAINEVHWQALPTQYQEMMREVAYQYMGIITARRDQNMWLPLYIARPNILGMLSSSSLNPNPPSLGDGLPNIPNNKVELNKQIKNRHGR
jgi:hypothetical protein